MDLLAATKMKATTTATILLTLLIAVGCSSAENNGAKFKILKVLKIPKDMGFPDIPDIPDNYNNYINDIIIQDINKDKEDKEEAFIVIDRRRFIARDKNLIKINLKINVQEPKTLKIKKGETLIIIGKRVCDATKVDNFRLFASNAKDDVSSMKYVVIKSKAVNDDDDLKLELVNIEEAIPKISMPSCVPYVLPTTKKKGSHAGVRQIGRSRIPPGIFSFTILLTAAVGLIFWNLQQKTKACNKEVSFSKQ